MIARIVPVVLVLVLGAFRQHAVAQADDKIAYVPTRPLARTADAQTVRIMDGAVPGVMELKLPESTYQVDLINSRGKVKFRHSGHSLQQLDLGSLRPGTWTLRAHTTEGMRVKRFVVMQHGKVAWSVPTKLKKR